MKMQVIEMPITDLTLYDKNPRKNDQAVEAVAASIRAFGFKVPVIVDADNVVVAGHTRIKAANRLGLKEVPVIVADDLTPEQVKAFRLADNKVAELSMWDIDLLTSELGELADLDFDMTDFGFDALPGDDTVAEDDFEPEVSSEPVAALGDVWQLGRHRLLCGDATDPHAIEALLDGARADMLLTDPPYGVDYSAKNAFLNAFDKGNHVQKPIANDAIADYRAFFGEMLEAVKPCLSAYNTVYIFMSGQELHTLRLALEDAGYKWGDYLVWVKNNHVLGRKDYNARHEFCVYGWYGKHKFYGDFSTTILEFPKPLKNDLHPTMKPVELLGKIIQDGTDEEMNVIDLFGGSGSTLMACEQLRRTCYMMELDPKYCDVIVKRWEALTGEQAVCLRE